MALKPDGFLYHAKLNKCYKDYVHKKTLDGIAAKKRARETAAEEQPVRIRYHDGMIPSMPFRNFYLIRIVSIEPPETVAPIILHVKIITIMIWMLLLLLSYVITSGPPSIMETVWLTNNLIKGTHPNSKFQLNEEERANQGRNTRSKTPSHRNPASM